MTTINLMVYRHSAFYGPILSAIAGEFLAHEDFEPTYTVIPLTEAWARCLPPAKLTSRRQPIGEIDQLAR